MPSTLISVSRDGIERQFPLHSFVSSVSFVFHVGKNICICFLLGLGPKLVFCITIFCSFISFVIHLYTRIRNGMKQISF